ncbi:MAG: BC1881 family protein [Cetobacterium sp.]
MGLKDALTCELVNELRNREGVEEVVIALHQTEELKVEGPIILLKIID